MLEFIAKNFQSLSTKELYAILKLRMEIFILEQKSFYLDLDNKDQEALHIIGTYQNEIMAYGRITTDITKSAAKIQRVCVAPALRIAGNGTKLMQEIMRHIDLLSVKTVDMDAQFHLQSFYNKFGFASTGNPFEEDGVMHIRMQKNIT